MCMAVMFLKEKEMLTLNIKFEKKQRHYKKVHTKKKRNNSRTRKDYNEVLSCFLSVHSNFIFFYCLLLFIYYFFSRKQKIVCFYFLNFNEASGQIL